MPSVVPSERIQRRIDSLLDQADRAIEAGEWERPYGRAEAARAPDPATEGRHARRAARTARDVATTARSSGRRGSRG